MKVLRCEEEVEALSVHQCIRECAKVLECEEKVEGVSVRNCVRAWGCERVPEGVKGCQGV